MRRVATQVRSNLPQLIALGILILAMGSASKRAIVPMALGILRFVWPFLLIWFIYRLIRGRVERAVKQFQEQMLAGLQNQGAGHHHGRGSTANSGQVLDLCPKCGVLQQANHRC
jgi:hypothetical protein